MFFKDKLNALIALTGVSNSRLAKALHIDPSLVSRWRSGSRVPSGNSEYYAPIASFFINSISSEYQRTILLNVLNISNTEITNESLIQELEAWIMNGYSSENDAIEDLLDIITEERQLEPSFRVPYLSDDSKSEDVFRAETSCIGQEGIRNAMYSMLDAIQENDYHGDVLFFSDMPFDWLTEEQSFYNHFSSTVASLSSQCNLKLIFPINSFISDSFSNLNLLLSLYMDLYIKPYICPKYRKGFFMQFLCIIPNVAAVSSNVISNVEYSIVTSYKDPAVLHCLTQEFNELLKQCYSPFKLYGSDMPVESMVAATDIHKSSGTLISKGKGLPQITMSPELITETIERTHLTREKKEQLLDAALKRNSQFLEHIQHNKNIIIITPPDINKIKSGELVVFHSRAYFGEDICYTPEEFLKHLKYTLELLEQNPNLQICITQNDWREIFVHANLGVSAVIIKSNAPNVTLITYDSKLVDMLYAYLENEYNELSPQEHNRNHTISTIKDWIKEVESFL